MNQRATQQIIQMFRNLSQDEQQDLLKDFSTEFHTFTSELDSKFNAFKSKAKFMKRGMFYGALNEMWKISFDDCPDEEEDQIQWSAFDEKTLVESKIPSSRWAIIFKNGTEVIYTAATQEEFM